ncbi:bestrophin-like domain [Mucilaginibacter agri]|uniref:DUF4239 domain-containing protein n=1 Tax=Mucilaginibacter agri TaxID=2695265 RepID=A0A965ZK06_9SPHI|nr:DUF4239 domain-containing protein [Mucilaginibacter agri]NCD71117.1 DUF4239 domain-containing protein [Mucilaginibacter agri]
MIFFYITLFILLSQVGLYAFSIVDRTKKYQRSNEVLGIMFGAISLIYSLVLAFVIIAVWQNYDELNKTIENETDKINSIMAHTEALPDSLKLPLKATLSTYCTTVIEQEWKMQKVAITNQPSAIPNLRMMLLKIKPADKVQQGVFTIIDEDLSAISDFRRDRLSHNRSQVPPMVWLILEAGSVLLVIFSYFFNVESIKLKGIYLFFLTSFIGMCMYLLYTLDHPFKGNSRVSFSPYQNILVELRNYYPAQTPARLFPVDLASTNTSLAYKSAAYSSRKKHYDH